MKEYLYLILLFFSIPVSAHSSGNTTNDTTAKQKTSLTLATLYSNNINYYGQTSSEKLPYILGYAAVKFPVGFWLSGQSYKLFDSQSGISGLNITAGYDFDLSKHLSGSLSYGRSFYPESSQLLQSVNQDVASAGLTYDWQWLTTGLNADYAIGQEGELYTSFKIEKSIDLGISFSSKDYFTLDPGIEIIGGTQRFSDTVLTQNNSNNPNNSIIGKVFNNKGKDKGKATDLIIPKKGNKATVVSSTRFDLLTYNFTLPLAYNRANYAVEVTYQGSILSKAISDSQKLKSFFNLGFYYMF